MQGVITHDSFDDLIGICNPEKIESCDYVYKSTYSTLAGSSRRSTFGSSSNPLIKLKKKVADDFDRGILKHERLDMYMQEREKILSGVKYEIKT